MSNINGINYINDIYRDVYNNKHNKIVFDFSTTTILETNLIAVMAYIFEKIYAENIEVILKLNGKTYENCSQFEIQNMLFNYYSADKNFALMPRKLGSKSIDSEESLLLKDLKDLQLFEYDKISVIISELIANLKMHTLYHDGVFAGYHDYKNSQIIFSIVNYDITIAKRSEMAKHMEFKSDYEAVLWALRKNTTTRQANESGGIGLFLLRKYISLINGRFTVLSGECCLACDRTCYDLNDENNISIKKAYKLGRRYEGTIITLFIPDKINEESCKAKRFDEIIINMDWLMGG